MEVSRNDSKALLETENTIDPRARPVILAAQALKFLREAEPGTNAGYRLHELRWCMDGLYLLIGEMPLRAQTLFARLDMKVQVLTVRLSSRNSGALDAVREELIERVTQLGDVLMDAYMRPPEEKGGQ